MFKSLKLYAGQHIELEGLLSALVDFGYRRQERVAEEGDFARRGGLVDIFPFTFELPIRLELGADEISSITAFSPSEGTSLWKHDIVIILPLSASFSPKASAKKLHFTEESPINNFLDIRAGDYVVHTQHGIGRFLGMEKLQVLGKRKDHLVVEYEGGEKLFVPAESMHLVQKYIAFQTRRPKLYRLGTKEWQRTKERARKQVQKLAWELLSLEAVRAGAAKEPFAPDTDWQKQFEETFPYEETPDQINAMREIKQAMESPRLMDRLLCGDVGYGKTEVAMRAAFKATMNNKQVAYLVPTTILAEQHYQNFRERLKDFPVTVEMLSRFKTKAEQKGIVEGLARGTVDVVIGTHRLLSGDVSFKDLGLVIIDEEQRFGVRAKEKLKSLRLSTDILTLTATPIPRTLYMGLMGARDLSVINTPPQKRLPVRSVVVEYDEDLIAQAILREVQRKGQVYFVHNHVQDLEQVAGRIIRALPPGLKTGLAHGQMSPHSLEQAMLDFLRGGIDVLFCTMIIESGIDIPRVNTIIINNAHCFGLSDLHQLRGRVGRFDRAAYAYFVVPKSGILDRDARKRLDAIQEHAYLGAGFKIAMEDLELRGAGNLLGVEQHGFIAAVGFDLYCRLLREAVSNFRKAGIPYA